MRAPNRISGTKIGSPTHIIFPLIDNSSVQIVKGTNIGLSLTFLAVALVTPLLGLLPVLAAGLLAVAVLALLSGDVEGLLGEVVLEYGEGGEDEAEVEALGLVVHEDAGDGEVVEVLAEDDQQVQEELLAVSEEGLKNKLLVLGFGVFGFGGI